MCSFSFCFFLLTDVCLFIVARSIHWTLVCYALVWAVAAVSWLAEAEAIFVTWFTSSVGCRYWRRSLLCWSRANNAGIASFSCFFFKIKAWCLCRQSWWCESVDELYEFFTYTVIREQLGNFCKAYDSHRHKISVWRAATVLDRWLNRRQIKVGKRTACSLVHRPGLGQQGGEEFS